MRTRKILFLQHSGNLGGAPKSLYQLAALVGESGFDFSIWVLGKGENRSLFGKLGGRVTYTSASYIFHASVVGPSGLKTIVRNILSVFISFFIALKIAVTERDVDIIYLNSSSLCFYGLFLKLFLRKRLICHLREPLKSTLLGRVIQLTSNISVDEFIAISEQEAFQFNKSNVTVVPNYLDTDIFTMSASTKLIDFSPDDFEVNIGYFGRITEENGIALIVQIGEIIKKRCLEKKFHVHVFGVSKNESANVKDICSTAKNTISFYPIVDQVEQYMHMCDIIIVPFQTPHFSRAQIEAMTIGKIVIASDIDPLNRHITDGIDGILVKSCDANSWFAKIEEVTEDKAYMSYISQKGSEKMANLADHSKLKIIKVLNKI